MRILQVAHGFYPDAIGGVEIYTRQLSLALAARGHEVGVAAPLSARKKNGFGLGNEEEDSLTRFLLSDPREKFSGMIPASEQKRLAAEFSKIVNEFQPEVIHFQHLIHLGWEVLETLQQSTAVKVLTLHDFYYLCPDCRLNCGAHFWRCACKCLNPQSGKGYPFRLAQLVWLLRRHRHSYLNALQNFPGHLIANSQRTLQIYRQNGLIREVEVIYPGSKLDGIQRSAKAPSGLPRIGFLGNVTAYKGIEVLVRAFNEMKAETELHIWGAWEPEIERRLKKQIQANPKIFVRGAYQRENISKALDSFEILAVPSIWEETYGLVIQEALAAGKVVAASGIGGIPERIKDGQKGFLIEPGNVSAWATRLSELVLNYSEFISGLDFEGPGIGIEEDAKRLEALYFSGIRKGQLQAA